MSNKANLAAKLSYLCGFVLVVAIFFSGGSHYYLSETKVQEDDGMDPAVKTVDFWSIASDDNQNQEILNMLVNKFNIEHENIHINLEMKSEKYYYKTFATAMASKTNPDISMLLSSQAVQFADKGFLLAIEPVMTSLYLNGSMFKKNTVEQTKLYDQYYGVPLTVENYIMLIRKDIFEANGLEIPNDLSELLTVLREVSSDNIKGIALPNSENHKFRSLLYFVLLNGGSFIDSYGNVTIRDTKNQEVYQFMQTLYQEELIYTGNSNLTVNDVCDLFINGEAAVILTTPQSLETIYKKTHKDFIKQIGAVEKLQSFSGEFFSTGPIFTKSLCIYKNSQRKVESIIFAEWLCKNYADMWVLYKYNEMPALVTNVDDIILNNEFTDIVYDSLLPYNDFPTGKRQNSVDYIAFEGVDVLNDFLMELALEDSNLDELISKYQNKINDWVREINDNVP